ncbi:DUF6210 family protein [Micromonospora sp. NPDC007271]|uniref:DUF6210 family protein n=1 Tax=Micromonospora sp. NPDC007271 TaxID=3154587 RepID=UPI003406F460
MAPPRYVFLDPDGTGEDWLFVIVAAPTGIRYQQQYGGTACRQGQLEGFLVPVAGADAVPALRQLFEGHFRGAGTWNHRWSPEEAGRLRDIVADVTYWACDGWDEDPHPLRWDETRSGDTDEAWVPVLTPDGPGMLVWANSD